MSPLTRWLGIVAIALVVLLLCNALVYRHRRGTFVLKQKSDAPFLKQRVEGPQLAVMLLFVLSLLLGVCAPYLLPQSSFNVWLGEPYAKAVYYAWCFLGCVVLGTLVAVANLLVSKRYASQAKRSHEA